MKLVGLLLLLGCAWLAGCGGGGSGNAGAAPPTAPASDGSTVTLQLTSVRNGAAYTIDVWTPPSYASGSTSYPVIYATEGDALYPPLGRFANFRAILQRRLIDAILVGIGGTQRRNADFLLPSALGYHAFVTEELIPQIERQFRADARRRVLSGLSHGGAFVLAALLLEAPRGPVFAHYLSSEGSLQQQAVLDLEQQVAASQGNKPIPASLVLARALGDVTNQQAVLAMGHTLAARRYAGLALVETAFQTTHVGVDNPAFEDAVVRIFER